MCGCFVCLNRENVTETGNGTEQYKVSIDKAADRLTEARVDRREGMVTDKPPK